jgi:hypothetical protein
MTARDDPALIAEGRRLRAEAERDALIWLGLPRGVEHAHAGGAEALGGRRAEALRPPVKPAWQAGAVPSET